MKEINQNFFNLFKKIESRLGKTDSDYFMENYDKAIKKDSRLNHYRMQMKTLSKLRNVEAHNPDTSTLYLIAEESIDILKKVWEYIEKPRRAYDISIKRSKMMFADINEKVISVAKIMKEKDFSFVPVLINGQFFGMFSSNVLFYYYLQTGESIMDSEITLNYLKEYIPIEAHISEEFIFVNKNTLLADVEKKLFRSYRTSSRIEAVLITENGNKDETILGMITAWDILNLYSKYEY